VPDVAGLPRARAASCTAEYAKAERAIDWLLEDYGRKPGDPPGARTEVLYEAPPTRVSARIRDELRTAQLLEGTLGRLHERFTLDRPFTLVLRSCGQSEAAWVPNRRELVICYDLIDTLYLLALHEPSTSLLREGVAN
jgi:hypothetical protein